MSQKNNSGNAEFFKSQVLGHPAGLFVLFFTEMWERFSFYGMRVLLINFLTIAAIGSNPGWEWTAENAGALFGTYAGLLYLTPILGGLIADKLVGYRWAVVIGCIIMTLGHASMALETEFSLYAGLALLVIGTGFFKPNITSVISQMYTYLPEKKDGAYTIFYMGVNAGAFFGMMLCGYLAENAGWSWGFGLAGIFMLLGCLQFWLAGPLFGRIGGKPDKNQNMAEEMDVNINEETGELEDTKSKKNPFTLIDKVLIVITSISGLLYLINDPVSKIGGVHLLPEKFILNPEQISGPLVITIVGLVLFLYLVISRIIRYERVVRDRMIAVIIFALFTVFFFVSFEQGATSLVLFARDFTQRTYVGTGAQIYLIVNSLLTIIPLIIITWVLYLLFKKTFKQIALSNIFLGLAFLGVWGVVIWMLKYDFGSQAYEITYQEAQIVKVDENNQAILEEDGSKAFSWVPVHESFVIDDAIETRTQSITIASNDALKSGESIFLHEELGDLIYLNEERLSKVSGLYQEYQEESKIIPATVREHVGNKVEITTSWFSILNSFFIIAFASFFSKWWESKYNPSAAMKYSFGLILMSVGFAILAFGSKAIPPGATAGVVRVSMIWLVLAYLFHTLGELCLSPVGLSYVSKLVPARMIAFMFGMWYLAIAIGNKLAGSMGGMIDDISEKYSMSHFFLIFTLVPLIAGIIIAILNPVIKKLMHGVK